MVREIKRRDTACFARNSQRLANSLTKLYDAAMDEIDLSVSQFALLGDIESIEPCNRSELAKCSGLDRTTVVRRLEVLRKKNLIEDSDDADGGVRLTEEGATQLAQGRILWRETQDKVAGLLDPCMREALWDAFGKIDEIDTLTAELRS